MIIWVTCDTHKSPDEDHRRCQTCLDMNLRQSDRLDRVPVDAWARAR